MKALLQSRERPVSGIRGATGRRGRIAGRDGFSLMELLVVINIAAYMLWLSLSPLFSLTSAYCVSEAAAAISSAIERGRSEAVNRRTYVWLLLQEENNQQLRGVRIGLVASGDGSANTNASNLIPLGKTTLCKGVGFADEAIASLNLGATNRILLPDCTQGLSSRVGTTTFVQGRSVTFQPQGEATTNATPSDSSGFDPMIVIPLREAHGTTLYAGNDAAVVIDGSVGMPLVYRQ